MTIRSKEVLRQLLDWHVAGWSWRRCQLALGLRSEASIYHWLQGSVDAEKANITDTDFFLTWPEDDPLGDYLHRHLQKARARRTMAFESTVIDAAVNGVKEPVLENGKLCYVEDPALLALGLSGPDAWLYETAPDGTRKPVVLTRTIRSPATVTIKLLEGLAPAIYGPKIEHTGSVTHRSVLVVGDKLPAGAPKPRQLPKPDDTEMTELERDLRERLAAVAARAGQPRPRPEGKANLGMPAPTGDPDDRPTRTSGEVDVLPSPLPKPVYARPAPPDHVPGFTQPASKPLDRAFRKADDIPEGGASYSSGRVITK
jgi:hypothetical protein